MTEKAPSLFWSDQWLELQRNYWEAWSQLYRQALNSASEPTSCYSPWAKVLDEWCKTLSAGVSEPTHAFVERLVEQAKRFFQWSEELTRYISTLSEPSKSVANWQEVLHAWIGKLQPPFSQSHSADISGAMQSMPPFFELPVDTLTRTLSSSSLLPGDFLQVFKPQGLQQVTTELHDRIGRFWSVPGVGYTREWQEQLQRTARLALDYQRALQEYVSAHGKLNTEILERLLKRLIERAEAGDAIKSLREIYDLWVDCCEETYNDFVLTDEYAELYGHLVNALMRLKHQIQNLMDEIISALNLPTRQEMTTLRCRQQEVRRELTAIRGRLDKMEQLPTKLKALEDEVSNADLRRLRDEVKTLQAELNVANINDLRSELKAIRANVREIAVVRQELEALQEQLNALKSTMGISQATAREPESLGNPRGGSPSAGTAPSVNTRTPRRTKTPRRS